MWSPKSGVGNIPDLHPEIIQPAASRRNVLIWPAEETDGDLDVLFDLWTYTEDINTMLLTIYQGRIVMSYRKYTKCRTKWKGDVQREVRTDSILVFHTNCYVQK